MIIKSFSTITIFLTYYAYSDTELSDSLSTYLLLERSNSPYIVTGTFLITGDGVLESEPGVEIRFDTTKNEGLGANIYNKGTINIQGAEAEPIIFKSIDQGRDTSWQGIACDSASESFFNYVIIQDSYSGLNFYKTNGEIKNSIIRNNYFSVTCFGENEDNSRPPKILEINYCTIDSNSRGIYTDDSTTIIVLNSKFINNEGDAISMHSFEHALFINNLIMGNRTGITADNFSQVTLINNTIIYNVKGIDLFDFTVPYLYNNVIGFNINYNIELDASMNTIISHNLIFGHDSTVIISGDTLEGLRRNTMVNDNDDSCDVYYNLSISPLFEDSTGFSYAISSPIWNAGLPEISIEEDTLPNEIFPAVNIYVKRDSFNICEPHIGASENEVLCFSSPIEGIDSKIKNKKHNYRLKLGNNKNSVGKLFFINGRIVQQEKNSASPFHLIINENDINKSEQTKPKDYVD
ncbi:right-handed parallel beta-helix repeat-containing protein [Fibrobacterota bacterium]